MSESSRFHLDENVPQAVAHGLPLCGLDVTTSIKGGLRGAADDEQLEFAVEESRVLVTYDRDFLAIASRSSQHAGIAFAALDRCQIGDFARGPIALSLQLSAQDVAGSVVFLSQFLRDTRRHPCNDETTRPGRLTAYRVVRMVRADAYRELGD